MPFVQAQPPAKLLGLNDDFISEASFSRYTFRLRWGPLSVDHIDRDNIEVLQQGEFELTRIAMPELLDF